MTAHTVLLDRIEKLKEISDESSLISKFVHNCSEVDVPLRVKRFLCYGPKFVLGTKPTHQILLDIVEGLIFAERLMGIRNPGIAFTTVQRDSFVRTIQGIDRSLNEKPNSSDKLCGKIKELAYVKEYFREHPELIVMLSDKGNISVILTKVLYHSLAADFFEQQLVSANYVCVHDEWELEREIGIINSVTCEYQQLLAALKLSDRACTTWNLQSIEAIATIFQVYRVHLWMIAHKMYGYQMRLHQLLLDNILSNRTNVRIKPKN